jgi:hypothetical protein
MEKLTITLTDRAPVTIVADNWPVIASAKDWDNRYEVQANRTWSLKVRQHNDGRTIVYGVYTTQYQNEPERRAGLLLTPPKDWAPDPCEPGGEITPSAWVGDEVVEAIKRVAEHLGFERRLADECIADLPALELVG